MLVDTALTWLHTYNTYIHTTTGDMGIFISLITT